MDTVLPDDLPLPAVPNDTERYFHVCQPWLPQKEVSKSTTAELRCILRRLIRWGGENGTILNAERFVGLPRVLAD